MDTTNIFIPIVTFVMGFMVSRFTMSKKERKDEQARLQSNSNAHLAKIDEKYAEFAKQLKAYASKREEPTLDDFYLVATAGDGYFTQMTALCDSILEDQVPGSAVANTFLPRVRKVADEILPQYFATLQDIAKRRGLPYKGEFRREDYESILSVRDKFCTGPPISAAGHGEGP